MTKRRTSIVGHPSERGSALVGVLLLLMLMSALVAALGVSGQTETLISRNQRSAAQAQAAAEAGLNHAAELATAYIFEWKANGLPNVEAALDGLLVGPDGASGTASTDVDNGSLGPRVGAGIETAEALPLGTQLAIANGIARYEAFVMDDDATAPTTGDFVEDGNLLNDLNAVLIVRATGYAQDNTKVTLEALITPIPLAAIVTNGDLDMNGNVDILGTDGSVHSNGGLTITGGAASMTGTVTASGTYTGSPAGSGGAPPLPVMEIHASDYLAYADFILTSAGTMTNQAGTVLCAEAPCNDWDFDYSGGGGGWSLNSTPTTGTYYVEGNVTVTGSPGSPSVPVQITIIAEGSIDISGSPHLTPDTEGIFLITDGDLEISGNLEMHAAGQILVHEQVKITGSVEIIGQLIVEDAAILSDLVTENELNGNVNITYNGGLNTNVYGVSGWRDIRDAT